MDNDQSQIDVTTTDKKQLFNHSGAYRSKIIALVLLLVLGQFGAHNFYLARTRVAVTQLMMSVLAWAGIAIIFISAIGGNMQADGSMDISSAFGVVLGGSLAGGVAITLSIWLFVDLILILIRTDDLFDWPVKK